MFEMLSFGFMRTALLVAVFVGAAAACIGQVVVLRRQSNMGDALSHSALAGVALGVILDQNPVIFSLLGTLIAAVSLELVRRLFPRYAEISTAVIMALAVGLAGIFSGFAGAGKSFQSYLFGSIVAITASERNLTIAISALVILLSIIFYKEIFFVTFDANAARLAGIRTSVVEVLFTVLTALTVGIASRSVGTLVISSLLVLPYAAAMQLHLSYFRTLLSAMIIATFNSAAGIILSYQFGLAPGGTIVVLSVAVLVLLSVASIAWNRNQARKNSAKRRASRVGES